MSLVRWDPFGEVDALVNRLILRPAHWPRLSLGNNAGKLEWSPSADISETDTEFVIRAELPAVRKEDVQVTLDEGIITIKGKRSFSLPENINTDAVCCDSKDGILTVHIPKSETHKTKPKQINETDIAVKVNGGEVTLTGFTGTYYEKHQAEVVGRRVKGVAALANDIQVKPAAGSPTDPEIARAALTALKLALPFTWEQIKPTVTQGRVALEGMVEWQYQREIAESAMRHLAGVVSLLNSIQLKPRVAPENIKHRIEDAFRRIAEVDAKHISVDANGWVSARSEQCEEYAHGTDVKLRAGTREIAAPF